MREAPDDKILGATDPRMKYYRQDSEEGIFSFILVKETCDVCFLQVTTQNVNLLIALVLANKNVNPVMV